MGPRTYSAENNGPRVAVIIERRSFNCGRALDNPLNPAERRVNQRIVKPPSIVAKDAKLIDRHCDSYIAWKRRRRRDILQTVSWLRKGKTEMKTESPKQLALSLRFYDRTRRPPRTGQALLSIRLQSSCPNIVQSGVCCWPGFFHMSVYLSHLFCRRRAWPSMVMGHFFQGPLMSTRALLILLKLYCSASAILSKSVSQ